MDKIYTRKRIKIPSVRYVGFPNGRISFKKKVMFNVTIVLIVALMTLVMQIKAMTPIIVKLCEDAAKSKATLVSNNMATEVMKNYTYDDFVKIYKDSNGNITMLQSNVITINEITSDVAIKIQQELIKDNEDIIKLKFRQFYRNKVIIRKWT